MYDRKRLEIVWATLDVVAAVAVLLVEVFDEDNSKRERNVL
jgi:hypothetical protein